MQWIYLLAYEKGDPMAIYMKIDGLKGDATDKSHAQWIQLTHIHFNMQRQIDGSVGDGSQREVSRPYFSEAVISKEACSASGGLFAYACNGKSIPQVELDVCNGSDASEPSMKYILSNVIISRFEDHTNAGALPSEVLELNYTQIERTFTGKNAANQTRTPMRAGYNLETAEAM